MQLESLTPGANEYAVGVKHSHVREVAVATSFGMMSMGMWCNRRWRPSSLPRSTAAASRVSLDRMTERVLATSQWILGHRLEWHRAKRSGPEASWKSCLGMETSLRTSLHLGLFCSPEQG